MSQVTEDPVNRARRLMAVAVAEAEDHTREWFARHHLQKLVDELERLVVSRLDGDEPAVDDVLKKFKAVGSHLSASYWNARISALNRAELYKTVGHWYERGRQKELARAQYDTAWLMVDRLAAGQDVAELTHTILTDDALGNAPMMLAVILKAIAGNGVYVSMAPQPGATRQTALPSSPESDLPPTPTLQRCPLEIRRGLSASWEVVILKTGRTVNISDAEKQVAAVLITHYPDGLIAEKLDEAVTVNAKNAISRLARRKGLEGYIVRPGKAVRGALAIYRIADPSA
ncbi:MAG: hypothetical protein U0871_13650 [Gemmataceae bacterium]